MSAEAGRLLTERQFLTAGGTETYLYFLQNYPLREFCAFEIFDDEAELEKLERDYLYPLADAVSANGHGLLLDSLIWRAHPDFIEALGYARDDIRRLNERAVAMTRASIEGWRDRAGLDAESFPVLINADIGPRGDGYKVEDAAVTVADAENYHAQQIEALAGTDIDIVNALTMTSVNESIGIVKAAEKLRLPIVISATVETDGRLPDGSALGDFIERVEDATSSAPLFYMVNCAHPTHLMPTLAAARRDGAAWLRRFKGFRANASRMSHEELDNSETLDRGNPEALGREVTEMRDEFGLCLIGGCCGTDVEHISAIARASAAR